MPKFLYKAKQGPKKSLDGVLEAKNLDDAVRKIVELGYTPIDVKIQKQVSPLREKTAAKASFTLFKRIPSSSIVLFTRQVADLVDAAVPILRTLNLVKNQTKNPQLKAIINEMYMHVRDGGSFSDAIDQHPNVFPKLYVNMVKAGEVSGKLGLVLNRLAELTEKEQETKNKVTSSLAYPFFILAMGLILLFGLITFVIPRLTVLFDDFNQVMPLPTIIVIGVSDFCARFWWLIIGIFVVTGLYVRKVLSTQKGRLGFDRLKLRIPLLGEFVKNVEIGRFARILGTLIESGVVIVTALNSVWAVLQNEVLKAEIKKVADEVTHGSSLTVALKECRYFPEVAVNMISVGEETGLLEKGLYKLANTYDRESERTVKVFISLLGPAFLVVVISIIGFILIALLLPILKMNMTVI